MSAKWWMSARDTERIAARQTSTDQNISEAQSRRGHPPTCDTDASWPAERSVGEWATRPAHAAFVFIVGAFQIGLNCRILTSKYKP